MARIPTHRSSVLLGLPFEVRQGIYEQLLLNLTVHVCPDPFRLRHGLVSPRLSHDRSGRVLGNFYDGLMACTGKHYQSLIKAGELSHVCSHDSAHQVYDALHLMLSCKDIYRELEPLLWSMVTFSTGLPQFGFFDMRYLAVPLRTRLPEIVPRANLLQKLILTLPRTDELASELGRDRRYAHANTGAYIDGMTVRSLTQLNTRCPNLHSIIFIVDATQLEYSPDPHQIIAYVLPDIQAMLSFHQLKDFRIIYNGSFAPNWHDSSNPRGHDGLTSPFKNQLEACQHALWEMLTGNGAPLDHHQDQTGWLGRKSRFVDEDEDARLEEFCERTVRHYNGWWMKLTVDEKKAMYGEHLDHETLHS